MNSQSTPTSASSSPVKEERNSIPLDLSHATLVEIQASSAKECQPKHRAFEYLVLPKSDSSDSDGLFPLGAIHLIAGPSGAGKSTWANQFILDYSNGRSFFGRSVCPQPFLVISFDRDEDAVVRTLHRMGISGEKFPYVAAPNGVLLPSFIESLWKANPELKNVRVFFVEGLDLNVPDGKINDPGVVKTYLGKLQQFCREHRIAIIGSVGSPKAKPGQKYAAPRDRILGTSMWGRMTETIVLIEQADPDNPDSIRELQVLPRNGKAEKHMLRFEGGRLVEVVPTATGSATPTKEDLVVGWLDRERQPGDKFRLDDLATGLGMNKGSSSYPIEKLIKRGWVRKERYGTYVWLGKHVRDANTNAETNTDRSIATESGFLADVPSPAPDSLLDELSSKLGPLD